MELRGHLHLLVVVIQQVILTPGKLVPRILEQLNINIWAERHRSIHTEYSQVNTNLHTDSPPPRGTATLDEMNGFIDCPLSFQIKLCQDVEPIRKICIYKDDLEERMGGVFDRQSFSESLIDLEGLQVSPAEMYSMFTPVSGFVVRDLNSVVKGYLIKKSFYGSIRFYDKYRLYHVVYYVEPASSVPFYNKRYAGGLPDENDGEESPVSENAIAFEYVSHSQRALWAKCGRPAVIPLKPNPSRKPPTGTLFQYKNGTNITLGEHILSKNGTRIKFQGGGGVNLEGLVGKEVKLVRPDGQVMLGHVLVAHGNEVIIGPIPSMGLLEIQYPDGQVISKGVLVRQNKTHVELNATSPGTIIGTRVKVVGPKGTTFEGIVVASGEGKTVMKISDWETMPAPPDSQVKIQYPNGTIVSEGVIVGQNGSHITVKANIPGAKVVEYVKVVGPNGTTIFEGIVVSNSGGQTVIKKFERFTTPLPLYLYKIQYPNGTTVSEGPIEGQNGTHITLKTNTPNRNIGDFVKVVGSNGTIFEGIIVSTSEGQTVIRMPEQVPAVLPDSGVIIQYPNGTTISTGPISRKNITHIVVKTTTPDLAVGERVNVVGPNGTIFQGIVVRGAGGQTVIRIPDEVTTRAPQPSMVQIQFPNGTTISRGPIVGHNDTHIAIKTSTPEATIGELVNVVGPDGMIFHGIIVGHKDGETIIQSLFGDDKTSTVELFPEIQFPNHTLISVGPITAQNGTHMTLNATSVDAVMGKPVKVVGPEGTIFEGIVVSTEGGQTVIKDKATPDPKFQIQFPNDTLISVGPIKSTNMTHIALNVSSPAVVIGSPVKVVGPGGIVYEGTVVSTTDSETVIEASHEFVDPLNSDKTSEATTEYLSTDPDQSETKSRPATREPLLEIRSPEGNLVSKGKLVAANATHIQLAAHTLDTTIGQPVKVFDPENGKTVYEGVVISTIDGKTIIEIPEEEPSNEINPVDPSLKIETPDGTSIAQGSIVAANDTHIKLDTELPHSAVGKPIKVISPKDNLTLFEGTVLSNTNGQAIVEGIEPGGEEDAGVTPGEDLTEIQFPNGSHIARGPLLGHNGTHLAVGKTTPATLVGERVKVVASDGSTVKGIVVSVTGGETVIETIDTSEGTGDPQEVTTEYLSTDPDESQEATKLLREDSLATTEDLIEVTTDYHSTDPRSYPRIHSNITLPMPDSRDVTLGPEIPPETPESQPGVVSAQMKRGTVKIATGPPRHSTESYNIGHSTDVPWQTDPNFIAELLGHSTEGTEESFYPPYHSTEITGEPSVWNEMIDRETTGPTSKIPLHSTTVIPKTTNEAAALGHSTDFTGKTIEITTYNPSSSGIPFMPSTEVTPAGTESTSALPLTTRKILDPEEVLAQLSTEKIIWPYHSTEESTLISEPTHAHATILRNIDFKPSTEHDNVIPYVFHSTEPPERHRRASYETTELTSAITQNRTTLNLKALSHSTDFPWHSTDFTGTVPPGFFPPVIPSSSTSRIASVIANTSIVSLRHSTEMLVHFTEVTLPSFKPNEDLSLDVAGSLKSNQVASNISTKPIKRTTIPIHSTAVSAPPYHSTTFNSSEIERMAQENYYEEDTTGMFTISANEENTNMIRSRIPKKKTARKLPFRSTERDRPPYHSTTMTPKSGGSGEQSEELEEVFSAQNFTAQGQNYTSEKPKKKLKRKTKPLAGHSTYLPPIPYHSTEVPEKIHSKRRRKRELLNLNNFFAENPNELDEGDVTEVLHFTPGTVISNLFDSRSEQAFICEVCIWIQPHFAEIFGLGGGLFVGVAEVIDIMKFANQIFRSLDLNQDGIPDNIGLNIKKILLTDSLVLEVAKQRRRKRALRKKRFHREHTHRNPNLTQQKPIPESLSARSLHRRLRRFKREYNDDGIGEILSELENKYDGEEMFGPRKRREDFEFDNYAYYEKYDEENDIQAQLQQSPHLHEPNPRELSKKKLNEFARDPKSLSPKVSLRLLETQLRKKMPDCCAILGFLYHDMTPSVAATTERGLCSRSNLGIVSGLFHGHKITKYDVYRGVMHGLGHLFGAPHDSSSKVECSEPQMYEFINPFPLHPIQQANVGVRPNSFRFSACAKDAMTMFLSSTAAHCLKEKEESFCGNGILESEEVCDCGSLWQCHLRYPCCGEADAYMGCKVVATAKAKCFRPSVW